MTDSQAYKAYIKKLSTSGLPTCKARLEMLADMERSEAFQWFQDNKLKREVQAPATGVDAFLADVLDDSEPEATPEPEKPAKKARKRVDASAGDEDEFNLFSEGVWNRYAKIGGLQLIEGKPLIGSTFHSKSGTEFEVKAVERNNGRRYILASRVA